MGVLASQVSVLAGPGGLSPRFASRNPDTPLNTTNSGTGNPITGAFGDLFICDQNNKGTVRITLPAITAADDGKLIGMVNWNTAGGNAGTVQFVTPTTDTMDETVTPGTFNLWTLAPATGAGDHAAYIAGGRTTQWMATYDPDAPASGLWVLVSNVPEFLSPSVLP